LPLFNDTVSKSDHTEVNNWKTATNEFEEIWNAGTLASFKPGETEKTMKTSGRSVSQPPIESNTSLDYKCRALRYYNTLLKRCYPPTRKHITVHKSRAWLTSEWVYKCVSCDSETMRIVHNFVSRQYIAWNFQVSPAFPNISQLPYSVLERVK
jgi:hypothetical protein